ncbi:MAG: cell division protein [Lysobacterales bacterium CG17_big_fil_post_rev_8_21_14_2_50_64_11]|nr:MAG: cell division protein [Xanthomonadales bacterium CG17_big_fil_post_rev_8_21_14_2_50_64_11]PIX61472.1 MAG: cell division protein [Xanthomonadales bacterium CG_4_10_14_3_um_filter_64_11]
MRMHARNVNARSRLLAVAGVLALATLALVARAGWLQLLHNDFYQRQGDARFLRDIPIAASRGSILDRNGEPLAVSTPVASIWANPQELLQATDRIPALAKALAISPDALLQRLAQRAEREFVYLRRHMSPDAAQAILALQIPGVAAQREFRRFYPAGAVAAHVLGFTNIDDVGQEGLELAFNDWLTGKPGVKRVIRDRLGRVVENVDLLRAAEPGRDLVLSIDRRLQYLAYRELGAGLREHDASAGSAVIIDVVSGEILALVNLPSYNPNSRDSDILNAQRNRALTDVFEPGSVMKAFTAVAAMESGKFTPDTLIATSPGYTTLRGGYTIHDFKDYGTLSMAGVLIKSSNVGAIKIADQLGAEQQYSAYRRFGLGQSTGSGFPGESAGVLPAASAWGPVEKQTIAYGYGVSVTALQLARAYAAFGNGGVLPTPTFVKGTPPAQRTVVDRAIAGKMLAILEAVTGEGGTATRSNVTGYRVAGKTGTSRKASGGGYADKRYVAVFVGLAPVSRPRLAMAVVINDPKGEEYGGGAVAAPVFRRIMTGALRVLAVPPDRIEQWYASMPAESAPAIAARAAANASTAKTGAAL